MLKEICSGELVKVRWFKDLEHLPSLKIFQALGQRQSPRWLKPERGFNRQVAEGQFC